MTDPLTHIEDVHDFPIQDIADNIRNSNLTTARFQIADSPYEWQPCITLAVLDTLSIDLVQTGECENTLQGHAMAYQRVFNLLDPS